MAALFPRWTNTVFRTVAALLVATPFACVGALMVYNRTGFVTGERIPIEQPVQFDHRHHTGDEGIDCRYCHTTVERAASAGMPAISVCMNCHAQVWNTSPLLDPIRRAYFQGGTIPWNRVHDLPDFVYFNHSIHIGKGVACVTCHGRVDQMAAVEQVKPLTMSWCLDCHRNPAPHIVPKDQVTAMTFVPRVTDALDVHARTACTTCHR